jgi:long-chain fatty acid transport protein
MNMKKVLAMIVVTLVGITAFSSVSFASGFRLPDQDSAAMAMGGAFVGQADNPSAVWYNPAGITDLDGTRISAGVIAIYPVLSHENTSGTTDVSERDAFLLPQIFATNKVNDRVSLGLGITSPFGLSTDWSETSATSTVATFSSVKTIDINPNVAYRLSDSFSVAIGINYIKLQATLEKLLPAPGNPIFRLDGEGSGWGANAGIKYKVNEQLNLGLSYRSRVKIGVDDATADVSALGLSNPVDTDITLPDIIQFGASYRTSDKLTLNADLEYTWWSTYDRLVIQSNTIHQLGVIFGNPSASDTSTEEKDWKNTWIVRLGGQYQPSDQWKLRAGYVYDQSPVPSDRFETRVPDSDRQGVSIGTGYTSGNITVDASYLYLRFINRSINNSLAGGSTPVTPLNGTYKSQAHLAGLTVAYKF